MNTELLKNMFTEGFSYTPEGLLAGSGPFTFRTADAGTVSLADTILIQGQMFPIGRDAGSERLTASVKVAVCNSQVFSPLNPDSEILAAVKIEIKAGVEVIEYRPMGQVYVDSGMLQVASSGYMQLMEDAQIALDGEGDVMEEMEANRIEGFAFKKTESNISIQSSVNEETVVDVDSGYGDGSYPVIFGYDTAGIVVAVYVDFQIFDRADAIENLLAMAK